MDRRRPRRPPTTGHPRAGDGRAVKAVAPERIVLHGSGARGEMTPDSDIDLLLVLETDDPERVQKLADESVRDATCILQLLVATEADLAARAHKPYDILYAALDDGVTLHDVRPPGERVADPLRGEISAGGDPAPRACERRCERFRVGSTTCSP